MDGCSEIQKFAHRSMYSGNMNPQGNQNIAGLRKSAELAFCGHASGWSSRSRSDVLHGAKGPKRFLSQTHHQSFPKLR